MKQRTREFLWGSSIRGHEYVLTRWVFLRGLGFVYLFAFGSLWPQVLGLIGSRGISPVADFLGSPSAQPGLETFLNFPTLLWLDQSDGFLLFLCGGGVLLSLLLIVGLLPIPALALLWLFYLSLVNAGQEFLAFQWDALLLEAGFLAIFFAPAQLLPGRPAETPPSRVIVWLFRLLLFRLMFFSGVAKLRSGDPTWHDLTALTYHYETQPLPTLIAWYVDQLPEWFHRLSSASMFAVELLVPFLIFAPRRIRFLAAASISGLMLLIMLTGNYAFFNLLTIVLCVLLLDDSFISHFLPARPREKLAALLRRKPPARFRNAVVVPLVVLVILLNTVLLSLVILRNRNFPSQGLYVAEVAAPFYLVNNYGLFAVMTTERPEIIVEGSEDGVSWRQYAFPFKPGALERPPGFVAPYHPRLDWQMWFAALGHRTYNPWFGRFLRRVMEGSPEVLALLEANPFPEKPPRYIRALLYDYRFGDLAGGGSWWRRSELGVYFPPSTLEELRTRLDRR